MPAPNQGRTAIKLHRIKLQKCPHPMPEKTPRPKTAKLPLKSPSPLPGSRGNQMEKVHGKSEERYSFFRGLRHAARFALLELQRVNGFVSDDRLCFCQPSNP